MLHESDYKKWWKFVLRNSLKVVSSKKLGVSFEYCNFFPNSVVFDDSLNYYKIWSKLIKTDRNTSKTVKIYLQCEGKLGNDTFEDHEVVLAPIVKLLKCRNSHDQII